ncbi:hypothetical protein [Pontibacter harenae]|uniref:hypothetical protein n=1 Tax=Pontibacter harenae TaxID=2894083 RepID=UPI003F6E8909
MATVVLWMITAYLIQERKPYWVTLIPAVFMSAVATSYILVAPEGFSLSTNVSYAVGIAVALMLLVVTLIKASKRKDKPQLEAV